ncbi:MAG: sulfotransferase family 2 domain-containing protein [Verrucomicrobiales bacterium]|nr:sulfotransferase family 2 domain-containing protein [Verrucomicrobiales bacterium]
MIVFLHIHKTGGTTFRSILEKNFSAACCHTNQTRREQFCQEDLEFAKKVFPRLQAITGHNIVDPLRFSVPDPFYATFLREPVARVISHYQDSVLRGPTRVSFEENIKTNTRLNNWQVKMLAGGENLDKAKRFLERCSFVGLTEKFNLSLHVFGKVAPCPMDLRYKRLIVAKDNAIQKGLLADPRMLDLAREHNRLDLELYAFALNEIFPKLCQKAEANPADTVSSYEVSANNRQLKFRFSRIYNKVWFRQIYKVRHRLFYPTDADLAAEKPWPPVMNS